MKIFKEDSQNGSGKKIVKRKYSNKNMFTSHWEWIWEENISDYSENWGIITTRDEKVSINIAPTALDLSLCEFSLSTKLRWPLIKAKINPHKLQRGNMLEMFQSFVFFLNSASADLRRGRGEGSLRNGNLFQSDRGHRLAVYLSDLWCYGSQRENSKYTLIFRVFRQN